MGYSCSPKKNIPSPHRWGKFFLWVQTAFTIGTEWSGDRYRDLLIDTPSQFLQLYRLFFNTVETWRWPVKAETCSFNCRIYHFSTQVVFWLYSLLIKRVGVSVNSFLWMCGLCEFDCFGGVSFTKYDFTTRRSDWWRHVGDFTFSISNYTPPNGKFWNCCYLPSCSSQSTRCFSTLRAC